MSFTELIEKKLKPHGKQDFKVTVFPREFKHVYSV